MKELSGLDGHELRIQTFAEGALLLAHWQEAVPPPGRDDFLRRLRSVDIVAPPVDRGEFKKALLPLAKAMKIVEKQDGFARLFRLHVPDEALRKRLRIGKYSGGHLQLLARAYLKLPEGERLVGDDPDADWPDIKTVKILGPEERYDGAESRFITQENFVHGEAVARHLFQTVEGECCAADERARKTNGPEGR